MFTGIIEELGHLKKRELHGTYGSLEISCHHILADAHIGDSIATNGVCLTITDLGPDFYRCDVMAQTLHLSNLGALQIGDALNLERAMPADGRFGGHMVSGHIDGVGTIRRIRRDGNAIRYQIHADTALLQQMVPQGSIAIDGISLTIAALDATSLEVSIIPHTLDATTLGLKQVGDTVNLECDLIGKYVARLLQREHASGGITPE
ncbi:MAG: riboflavin synthase, partial [Lachnospiraceae bacterium]|nr:riboflavin synthase [Lachnospiraceae bacterium]